MAAWRRPLAHGTALVAVLSVFLAAALTSPGDAVTTKKYNVLDKDGDGLLNQ